MRGATAFWLVAVLAVLAGPAGAATVSVDKLERINVSGREYVRVRDWANANRLTVTWPQAGKTVRVSNGAGSVLLTADSRMAVISGIKVALSFPVVVRVDKAYVSLLDLRKTIVPLLSPSAGPGAVRVIAIDAGHGGKDKGYWQSGHYEKTYTLALARELREQLLRAGVRVILTRDGDNYVDLSDRAATANDRRADLMVSLHFNSGGEGNKSVKGVETYCVTPVGASSSNAGGSGANHGPVVGNLYNDRSVLLAWQVQKSLVTKLGMEDRGLKRARFEVLCAAAMPSVLVEGGFLSHPTECKRILDPVFRRQMAKAIVDGILNYKRLAEPVSPAKKKR